MSDGSAQASPASRGSGGSGADPLIGRVINDRFKVVAIVARGGMGKLYRAEQAPLGRTCALKVLNPKYAGDHDPEFHKRFFLEASIASKLTHPNTVTIFDYGRSDDDIYYMAMEFLEGRTLHRAIREEGPFGEERTAHIARQVCRSLREAHSLGVIHRDLKPANVFLVEHADEQDFVKVIDFGLVKNVDNTGEDLTQAGLFMGSPKYMAPEQIKGDRVDGRTDIYSLGIIMYEMMTGRVPFDRPNSVHIMMAHVNEPPPPMRHTNPNIQISQATEELILRCLEKDPNSRFPSMESLLNSLKTISGGTMTATLSGVLSSGDFLALTGSGSCGAVAPVSGPGRPMFMSPASSSSQTGPLPIPQSVEALNKSRYGVSTTNSKGVLVAAVVAVLVIALGSVVVFSARDASEGTPSTSPSQSTTAPTATTTTTAAVTWMESGSATAIPAPAAVTLQLDSRPSGASVKNDAGQELCSTPCALRVRGEDAAKDKEMTVTFSKPGYLDEKRTIKSSERKVSIRLVAIGGGASPPPKPTVPTPPTTPPPGFKDIPY
ncbi:MAG: protein kinase [Polyangiaceae bacterium]|jgi:serine/threonine-protein kinase|nr:protein kinase [Polyangiaceae bacterium]